MIKLIDLRSEVQKDVEFGTCELCMYTSDHYVEYFVFQDDTGEKRELETGYWDWGDYTVHYSVGNIPLFAEFILEKGKDLNFSDFDEETCDCGCCGEVFNLQSWFNEVYTSYREMIFENRKDYPKDAACMFGYDDGEDDYDWGDDDEQ